MPSPQQIEDRKTARRKLEDKLAADVIEECRTQLMLKFRFLDLALWRMELEPLRVDMRYPTATDGEKVYMDPPRVVARFQASFAEAVRDYLHLTMHCIFRHPFDEDHPHKEAWWLACDLVCESAVMDMCGDRFACEDDRRRRELLDELIKEVGSLVPGKLYLFFRQALLMPDGASYRGYDRSKVNELHALFERDNHESWPGANNGEQEGEPQPGEVQELGQDDPGEQGLEAGSDIMEELSDELKEQVERTLNAQKPQDDDGQDTEDGSQEAAAEGEEEADAQGEDAEGHSEAEPAPQAQEKTQEQKDKEEQRRKDWEDLAKQIEMDIQTFSQEWGDEAGSLIASLRIANRKKYDYTTFLRQFMQSNELMKVNQDEFDYIYYTFGMDMYGNMPFIEPLEYKEEHKMRDLAIVIDTSESVSGPLVRRFLEHTFCILKEFDSFTEHVNVWIIQCDSRVQAAQHISRLEEVDALMENFHIRGFGGTDFRPAFAYVRGLRETGALRDLKGLIYFTDGLGAFPEKAPDYDAAFVFMDDGSSILPPVPPWAIKVVIDEENITQLSESDG
ncbi:MAG: VWA-like domain-containing protein [Coriobacteriales bacterium]